MTMYSTQDKVQHYSLNVWKPRLDIGREGWLMRAKPNDIRTTPPMQQTKEMRQIISITSVSAQLYRGSE